MWSDPIYIVSGGSDNTEMLPDLSYEVTNYMKAIGYYSIWEKFLKLKCRLKQNELISGVGVLSNIIKDGRGLYHDSIFSCR